MSVMRGWKLAEWAMLSVAVAVVAATWLGWELVVCLAMVAAIAIFFGAWYVVYTRSTGRPLWSPLTVERLLEDALPRGGLLPPPLFFLSYARDITVGDDGPEVVQFFRDLEQEVTLRSGKVGDCGMWDRKLREGSFWQIRLLQALNSCKVVVAVCSPAFYDSEYCAQELDFLQLRGRLFPKPGETTPVIKVQWMPSPNARGVLPEIQDNSLESHPTYKTKGLRAVKKENPKEYRDIVEEKADEIALLSASRDPYSWDLPSFSPTVIPWPKGLAGIRELAYGARRTLDAAAQPVVMPQAAGRSRRKWLVTAALLYLLFAVRAGVLLWGYYEFRKAQYEPAPRAAVAMCERVHRILVAVHGPATEISKVDNYEDLVEAEVEK